MATIFLDTETTGLNPDDLAYWQDLDSNDDIWEFAAIKRGDGLMPTVERLHLFIEHDYDKALRLPEPFLTDYQQRLDWNQMVSRQRARELIGAFMEKDASGRHQLIGAVPDFDTAGLRSLLQITRSKSPWHYHITDVETLIVGFLAGRGFHVPFPYNSDDLSRMIGVDPGLFDRHTAMGDVLWTIANYDAVTQAKNPLEWALREIATDPMKPRDVMRSIAQAALDRDSA